MANVGPPSGGGPTIDPVKNIFNKATIEKVIVASKQMNSAMKVMAKNISLAAKKRIQLSKEERKEREYNLIQAGRELVAKKKAEDKFEKDFAKLLREDAQSKEDFQKEFASLLRKEEENNEKKYIRDITAMLREEHNEKMRLEREFNREFRELLRKEAEDNLKAVRESRKKEKEEKDKKKAEDKAKSKEEVLNTRYDTKFAGEEKQKQENASKQKIADDAETRKGYGLLPEGKEGYKADVYKLKPNIDPMDQIRKTVSDLGKRAAAATEKKDRGAVSDRIGGKSGNLSFSESMGVKAGDIFNGGLRKASEGVFAALGSLGGMFKTVVSKFQFVTSAVAAVNPALIMQLGFAFKDLYAVFGKAFQPLVQLLIAGIRAFADFMMPIASEFQAIFAGLGKSILKLFISLFPTFEKIFSIVAIFLQVFTYIIDGITFLIDPIIYALSGFVTLLAIDAAIAVISFAVSVMTMTTLMTAGISILIGAIAWLVTSIFKSGNSMKNVKPGSSTGMGARQASYSGIAEYGKNLMQQSLSGSTQNAAMQTAQYTRESRDFLQQIANKGNGPRQDGGVGVGEKPDKTRGDWGDKAAGWVASFFV